MTKTTTDAPRREPWPIALALALGAMIGVCLAFYAIAASHPDPPLELEQVGLRPSEGYVAGGADGARAQAPR